MLKRIQDDKRLPGYLLIGLGAAFLLTQIFDIDLASELWPFFVIIPGLPFLYFALTRAKNYAGLIFPGIIITGTGLILLFQNITDYWQSWAYAWTLYPVFVGISLVYNSRFTGNDGERSTGRAMTLFGLVGFVVLGLLFELLIFQNIFGDATRFLLPVVIIGAGAAWIAWRGRRDDSYKPKRALVQDSAHEAEDPILAELNKRKNAIAAVPTPSVSASTNGAPVRRAASANGPSPDIDPDLRRKIDEALAEDDPPEES